MTSARLAVGINFDSKCNARCAHCCVSSSPQSTANLTDEAVDRILDELLDDPSVRSVGLTGGEPLLRRTRTIDIIRRVTSTGRTASCVTNGYWGVTPRAADRVLRELEDAGLRELTLSYDDFHAPFIKPFRIKNVLDAAFDRRVSIVLNVCVSRTRDSRDLLAELGDSINGIPVTKFPVVPAGEARSLDESEFQRRPISAGSLHCPGNQVIFHNDGLIYPCCSPPIFDTDLTLGRVGEQSFADVVDRFERNALLGIVRREGFQWFIDAIRAVDPDAPAAVATHVISACELCALVFRDERSIRLIEPQVRQYWDSARAMS
jgi:YydG family peptide modification radical SAM enzyme